MSEKTALIVGGVVLVGGVLLLISQKQTQAAQQAALETQLANVPATASSGLGSLLSGIGASFSNGSIGSLFEGFTGGDSNTDTNDPGFISGDSSDNDPGLVSFDDEDFDEEGD